MIHEAHVAPPNSVILVMDQTVGEVPVSMHQGSVAATASCVAVGTRSEADGNTRITLSDESPPRMSKDPPVFDGVLPIPSKRLSVCSVLDNELLVLDVPTTSMRVRIWINDPVEPSELWILVGNGPD